MGQRRGQQSSLAAGCIGLVRFGNQGLLLIGRWFHEPLGPFGSILGMNRIVLHIGGRFVVVVMVVLHGIGAARRSGRSLLLCYRLWLCFMLIIVLGMRFLHVIAMGLWCRCRCGWMGRGGRGTFPRGLPCGLVIIIRLVRIGIDRGLPSRRQQHGRRRRSGGGTILARGGSDGIGRLGRGGGRLGRGGGGFTGFGFFDNGGQCGRGCRSLPRRFARGAVIIIRLARIGIDGRLPSFG